MIVTAVAILGGIVTVAGAGWGAALVFATKVELAQTDAKADYSLFVLLDRAVASLTRIKDKPATSKTVDDWKQIDFLEQEVVRLRKLISGAE